MAYLPTSTPCEPISTGEDINSDDCNVNAWVIRLQEKSACRECRFTATLRPVKNVALLSRPAFLALPSPSSELDSQLIPHVRIKLLAYQQRMIVLLSQVES